MIAFAMYMDMKLRDWVESYELQIGICRLSLRIISELRSELSLSVYRPHVKRSKLVFFLSYTTMSIDVGESRILPRRLDGSSMFMRSIVMFTQFGVLNEFLKRGEWPFPPIQETCYWVEVDNGPRQIVLLSEIVAGVANIPADLSKYILDQLRNF